MKLRNTIILLVILIAGFVLIRLFSPQLSIPYFNFAFLLLFSIYLWSAISPKINRLKPTLKYIFSFLYWLPMLLSTIASLALVFTSMEEWPDFFRVYFVGGLFTYVMSMLFPVLFLFMADILRFIEMLWKKKSSKRVDKVNGEGITRRKFLINTGLSLGGLTLGTMGFGMLHGNYDFKIWEYPIKLPKLPTSVKGLRIVQISDFHLGTWVSKKPLEEAVNYINDLEADLVFFTGDLVNSMTEEAFPFVEELAKVKARYGIYASLGNHDYGHYHKWDSLEEEQKNWDDLIDLYKNIGWKLLRNENEMIEINGSRVHIVGVENWSLNSRFPRLGDLDAATKGIASSDLNLLLSHDPTHWEQKAKDFPIPMNITFSGHTHGFQFGIESKLFRWSPAQYIYKHWAGLYKDDSSGKYLNVNRGIGAIGFPGRVGIKPEITLVELV